MQTYSLKFIVIGDSGVGKSSLAKRFTKKTFDANDGLTPPETLEFSTRDIPFEKCIIKAQIWDTAGQERGEKMSKVYYKDAVGAILIYDVTNPSSFENLKTTWMNQIHNYGHEKMSLVLVGNKADLKNHPRRVSTYNAAAFAESKRMDFIETSASSGDNVENAFRRLVLSVAKLIPDVKVHLDLLGLPDGWMSTLKFCSDPYLGNQIVTSLKDSANAKSSSAKSSSSGNDSPSSRTTVSPSANQKFSNRVEIGVTKAKNTSRPSTPLMKRRSSSYSASTITPTSVICDAAMLFEKETALTDMNSSIGSTNFNDMITIFTNYWTGEETLEIPKQPAPTGFLFEAKLNMAFSRFSEFDEPINRNALAYDNIYESDNAEGSANKERNVIVSISTAITTLPLSPTSEMASKKKSGQLATDKCFCAIC